MWSGRKEKLVLTIYRQGRARSMMNILLLVCWEL
jgi:hypothetical protein